MRPVSVRPAARDLLGRHDVDRHRRLELGARRARADDHDHLVELPLGGEQELQLLAAARGHRDLALDRAKPGDVHPERVLPDRHLEPVPALGVRDHADAGTDDRDRRARQRCLDLEALDRAGDDAGRGRGRLLGRRGRLLGGRGRLLGRRGRLSGGAGCSWQAPPAGTTRWCARRARRAPRRSNRERFGFARGDAITRAPREIPFENPRGSRSVIVAASVLPWSVAGGPHASYSCVLCLVRDRRDPRALMR